MSYKAAFIDFQGTLGGGGTDDIRSLEFFPFTSKAIRNLNVHEILVIGITNQSHISKGELTWDEFNEKLCQLKNNLALYGAHFDAVYCCPHTVQDNCTCKKPKTGMIDQALKDFDINLKKSYIIGDMGMTDMVLAKNVGAKAILVLTGVGRGSLNEYRHTWENTEPDFIAENLLNAVDFILNYTY